MRSSYLAKSCPLPMWQVGGFYRVFEKALRKLVDPTITDQMRGQPSLAVRHTQPLAYAIPYKHRDEKTWQAT
jgi:hypothetical protein